MSKTLSMNTLVAVALVTAPKILCAATPDEIAEATTPVPRDDDWWVERHAAKLAERDKALAEGATINLVFVGDSITHGWEDAGADWWRELFARHGAMNIGYSGDRTEHVLWRLRGEDDEIAGLSPKLFVVMIGTNNTGHRRGAPEATAAGVRAIVDRLLEGRPESRVLLLAVFPRGATSDDPLRKINDGVNALIAGYGDGDRVHFLDIADAFLEEDGVLPESVMPDLLHPEGEGYRLWAEAIGPHVRRLLAAE